MLSPFSQQLPNAPIAMLLVAFAAGVAAGVYIAFVAFKSSAAKQQSKQNLCEKTVNGEAQSCNGHARENGVHRCARVCVEFVCWKRLWRVTSCAVCFVSLRFVRRRIKVATLAAEGIGRCFGLIDTCVML
jgi:hypothetical protein